MRIYRVIRLGSKPDMWSGVKARTPRDAIKKVYKDHDVYIRSCEKEECTHRVELMYSKKEHVSCYDVKVLGIKEKILHR